ncbi:MAG: ATP-dependent carboxylate-amine ligase [Chloroflexi bacterium]|nr:ATP-dependent carboxylate-amine ligase [Chloroflexota bacterium]
MVLTAAVDPTADAVIQHLNDADIPLARFDAAQFPTEVSLTATLDDGRGWHAKLGGSCLTSLRSVYYRRPRRFAFDPTIPAEQLNWCEGQARYGFWGVLESLPVTWINSPSAVQQAEYKPRQLHVARQAGLSVPKTMITSRPDDVAAFAADAGGSIVTKPLYARTPRNADGYPSGVLYTADVPSDRYSDPGIGATAHLFQATINSAYDVRLTVVGNDLLAAEIHRERDSGGLDWRQNHHDIHYQPCEVPGGVAHGVRQLMRALGLSFGAFDFAVDDAGAWWFYEVNPNGQWLWIEQQTGLAISAALAELLKGPL